MRFYKLLSILLLTLFLNLGNVFADASIETFTPPNLPELQSFNAYYITPGNNGVLYVIFMNASARAYPYNLLYSYYNGTWKALPYLPHDSEYVMSMNFDSNSNTLYILLNTTAITQNQVFVKITNP